MIICKLCEKKIKSIKSLSIHLRKHKNITIEEYYNKFLKKGNNDSCLVCRNKTKFISLSHGYNIYCSRNCSGNDAKNRIKKTQETMILKYGVSNCSSLDWVKQKKKDTCNKNHNADFPFQSNKIKEKIKQTMIIKYDNEHPMKVPSIKDKAIKNMTQTKNTKEFKEKHIKLIHKKFYLRLISSDRLNFACTPLFNIDEYKGITHNYNWKCNKCNNVFFDNLDDGKIPRCNICYPKKTPIIEKEVSSFIKSIGDINIIENDRIALNGKEIDIYIP
ncbi:MAG: hypothetical protein KAS32_17775, partial [Candidatus Peribacteraceae bacterium]|nr:hypothetical protein [Candidatus Peribacteraceae bacterium]